MMMLTRMGNGSRALSHLLLQQQQQRQQTTSSLSMMLVHHSTPLFATSQQSQQQQRFLGSSSSSSSSSNTDVRCFSAAPAAKLPNFRVIPPNLKIDPKAKRSPFVSAPLASAVKKETEDDEKSDSDSVEAKEDNDDDEEDDDEEDDDIDEEIWFQPNEPNYVVPLPDRLTVNIVDKNDLTSIVGSLKLSSLVFGQDPIRVDILKRCVVYQRNKKRGRRKAKTKTISEVSGSGRKVRPQKGGGTARAGHKRPGHWRGGARAHGPKGSIQDYTTKLNKKVRSLGKIHAMSQKLKEGNLIVVNDFMLETHKTRDLTGMLANLGLGIRDGGKSAYLVDWVEEENEKVYRHLPIYLKVAASNIPRTKVTSQASLNVYDMLKYEKLILTTGAVAALEKRFGGRTY